MKSQSELHVLLSVRAPEEATEIFVIGDRFKKIASGLGKLDVAVPPGFYKVRFRSGMTQKDQLVEVGPDQQPIIVHGEHIDFEAAAPITETRTHRENHALGAEKESYRPHLQVGTGSQLFLFVRDLDADQKTPPWSGVSVHAEDGTPVATFESGFCSGEQGFGALNLEVDPGIYRLRVETPPLGTYEMFVITSRGWQTQVFCVASDFRSGKKPVRRIQLKTASMLMVRSGMGFVPSGQHVRLAELARLGLAYGRNIVRGKDLSAMLYGKFENPMLGVYVAHLLMLEHRPRYDLIETVIQNVQSLIGPHPDVTALQLRRGSSAKGKHELEFPKPPMLRASWDMITRSSLRRGSVVPAGSMTDLVADGLLNIHPWLLYRQPQAEYSATPDVSFAQAQRMLERLTDLGTTDEGRGILKKASTNPKEFSPLEQKIIDAALSAKSLERASEMHESKQEVSMAVSMSQILRSFDAPTTSIARSTGTLFKKLDLPF